MQKTKLDNAKSIATFLTSNGLHNTAKWIVFASKNGIPDDRKKDMLEVLSALRTEIKYFRNDAYPDTKFKTECFQVIFNNFIQEMDKGRFDFFKLIKKLTPVFGDIAKTNDLLKDISEFGYSLSEKQMDKQMFYQFCFAYLISYEGPYKNVEAALVALNELSKGKKVEQINGNKRLTRNDLLEVLPECLKNGNHRKIRNSIAHCHFCYIEEQGQIEFWDLNNNGNLTLPPVKLNFNDFSQKLLEVNIFCNIFAVTFLTLVAFEDIVQPNLKLRFKEV